MPRAISSAIGHLLRFVILFSSPCVSYTVPFILRWSSVLLLPPVHLYYAVVLI